MLEANQNSAEWQAFINSLTTNLTAFFAKGTTSRCCQSMLVGVAVNIASGVRRRRPVKNLIPLRLRWPIPWVWRRVAGVFASDIDTEVLEKAERRLSPG
jgi:chemotaxis protein methyltransferase CheR